MGFKKLIVSGLVAFVLNCAPTVNVKKKNYFDIPVSPCPNYTTSRIGYADLQVVAGLYSGTMKVSRKDEGGFDIVGVYSEAYADAILMACIDADHDRDRLISDSEAFNLSIEVQERYASKNGY